MPIRFILHRTVRAIDGYGNVTNFVHDHRRIGIFPMDFPDTRQHALMLTRTQYCVRAFGIMQSNLCSLVHGHCACAKMRTFTEHPIKHSCSVGILVGLPKRFSASIAVAFPLLKGFEHCTLRGPSPHKRDLKTQRRIGEREGPFLHTHR